MKRSKQRSNLAAKLPQGAMITVNVETLKHMLKNSIEYIFHELAQRNIQVHASEDTKRNMANDVIDAMIDFDHRTGVHVGKDG